MGVYIYSLMANGIKTGVEKIMNLAVSGTLSGAFLYRTFVPLSYIDHPVLKRIECGEDTYTALAGTLAVVSLAYLTKSISDIIKD